MEWMVRCTRRRSIINPHFYRRPLHARQELRMDKSVTHEGKKEKKKKKRIKEDKGRTVKVPNTMVLSQTT